MKKPVMNYSRTANKTKILLYEENLFAFSPSRKVFEMNKNIVGPKLGHELAHTTERSSRTLILLSPFANKI